MSKKVCMFVWNHFTNDARVLRECSALSEVGYEVDLIAIHDYRMRDLPQFESRKEGFHVTRVNNNIAMFRTLASWLSGVKRRPQEHWMGILAILALFGAG